MKKATNEKLLELIRSEKSLIWTIRQKQFSLLDHLVRKAGIGKLVTKER